MINGLLIGALAGAFALAIVLAVWSTWYHDHATIAGMSVPVIACQEDEVIGWRGVDTLGCIHYEEVNR